MHDRSTNERAKDCYSWDRVAVALSQICEEKYKEKDQRSIADEDVTKYWRSRRHSSKSKDALEDEAIFRMAKPIELRLVEKWRIQQFSQRYALQNSTLFESYPCCAAAAVRFEVEPAIVARNDTDKIVAFVNRGHFITFKSCIASTKNDSLIPCGEVIVRESQVPSASGRRIVRRSGFRNGLIPDGKVGAASMLRRILGCSWNIAVDEFFEIVYSLLAFIAIHIHLSHFL
jgi:hypothetical protein